MVTSDEVTPPLPEVDGERWITGIVGTKQRTDDGDGVKPKGKVSEVKIEEDSLFVFPVYGLKQILGQPKGRTQRDVVRNVTVLIPKGTQALVYRPYNTRRDLYVAAFFVENAIINVFGDGIVKRRDLLTNRHELLE